MTADEWVPSELPCPMKTGRTSERKPVKRDQLLAIIRKFQRSGDECWRKDYEGDTPRAAYKAAERDAIYMGQVANCCGCMVSRRGASLYLTRRGE